jgi:membrane-bound lytic murein transglycosylase D
MLKALHQRKEASLHKLFSGLSIVSLFATLSACQSQHHQSWQQPATFHHTKASNSSKTIARPPTGKAIDSNDDVTEFISQVDQDMRPRFGDDYDISKLASSSDASKSKRNKEINEIPLEINAAVRNWVKVFTVKERALFQRYLDRGQAFQPMIYEILAQYGVPRDLYYLALIESGFSTHAHSKASAVGVWQFIKGTGKRYGLRVDYYVDQRRDPILATHAAAQYLGDLYRVYQSWYLAMASYNAGERRILNAIMGGKTRNFWELVKKKKLPRETMNYIPKFIAATIIGEHPKKYGFKINSAPTWDNLAIRSAKTGISLRQISRTTGIPLKTLRQYNPQYVRDILSSSKGKPILRLPQNYLAKFDRKATIIAKLKPSHKNTLRYASNKRYRSKQQHRVKRGDTLISIARKHRTTVKKLKQYNNLKSSRIYRGQKLRVKHHQKTASGSKTYRVRHGDNLYKISKQFGVSIRRLKSLNSIKRSRIFPGQVIKLASR